MTDFPSLGLPIGEMFHSIEGGKLLETSNGEPLGVTPTRREVYRVDQDGAVAVGFLQYGSHDDDE